jgi:hypothetical protein
MSHGRSIHGRAIESKMAQAIFFKLLLLFGSGLSGLWTGNLFPSDKPGPRNDSKKCAAL